VRTIFAADESTAKVRAIAKDHLDCERQSFRRMIDMAFAGTQSAKAHKSQGRGKGLRHGRPSNRQARQSGNAGRGTACAETQAHQRAERVSGDARRSAEDEEIARQRARAGPVTGALSPLQEWDLPHLAVAVPYFDRPAPPPLANTPAGIRRRARLVPGIRNGEDRPARSRASHFPQSALHRIWHSPGARSLGVERGALRSQCF
jgi:hypothetical protein